LGIKGTKVFSRAVVDCALLLKKFSVFPS